ncbi:MAG: oligopeptide/dipeptide ABC transporter ATP-binding protein [Betaproteobacteria bacterium]
MSEPLLELKQISKRFEKKLDAAGKFARSLGANLSEEIVHAVDRVDLTIRKGEVVGLVGESGCGKSTLGRVVVGLHPQSAGSKSWRGKDVATMTPAEKRAMQLEVQMIFQDPYASLNPRLRVEDIIGEAPVVHGLVGAKDKAVYVAETMQRVGLDPALSRRFPHQFSGGQRARIGIARALAVKPNFLVCDEAVAALDVSIQAQVLNLFIKLREELDLTYLFISHDLGVVRHLSDRVVIMYLGRVVETAPADELFAAPNHPYTQGLLAEVPSLEVRKKDFVAIKGEIPSPLHPPSGCHFHPRCPHAAGVPGDRCRTEQPMLKEIAINRFSACHLNP